MHIMCRLKALDISPVEISPVEILTSWLPILEVCIMIPSASQLKLAYHNTLYKQETEI